MLTLEWVLQGNDIELNVEQLEPILNHITEKVKSYTFKNSRIELEKKLSGQKEITSSRYYL